MYSIRNDLTSLFLSLNEKSVCLFYKYSHDVLMCSSNHIFSHLFIHYILAALLP